MKKYKLIANPQAGRGKAAGIIEKTLKLLNKRNIAFDLQLTWARAMHRRLPQLPVSRLSLTPSYPLGVTVR